VSASISWQAEAGPEQALNKETVVCGFMLAVDVLFVRVKPLIVPIVGAVPDGTNVCVLVDVDWAAPEDVLEARRMLVMREIWATIFAACLFKDLYNYQRITHCSECFIMI
jgi:hypothetical protein